MPWKPGAVRNSPSRDPEYRRNQNLKRNYGITTEDYERMLEEQGGRCAICKTDQPGGRLNKYFNVDHCHSTGKVRGLLCMACNTMLGQADDDITTLSNAITYLESAGDHRHSS